MSADPAWAGLRAARRSLGGAQVVVTRQLVLSGELDVRDLFATGHVEHLLRGVRGGDFCGPFLDY